MKIFRPDINLARDLSEFVKKTDFLVGHDPHFYKIMIEHFGKTALIAKDKNQIIGWVFAIPAQDQKKPYFLWQICVDPKWKKQGIGLALINHLELAVKEENGSKLRATVNLKNNAACKFFARAGFANISRQFPNYQSKNHTLYVPNYYFEKEDMLVFEKNLKK